MKKATELRPREDIEAAARAAGAAGHTRCMKPLEQGSSEQDEGERLGTKQPGPEEG